MSTTGRKKLAFQGHKVFINTCNKGIQIYFKSIFEMFISILFII